MSNAATRKRNVTIEPGYFEFRNLRQRLAASAVLDFSGSMAKYAPQLPDAWKQLVEFLNKRAHEKLAVELACCPFSTRVAFRDFAPTTYYMGKKLTFEEMGSTSLGTALCTVIEHTRRRRQMLAAEGIDSLQAVCIVVTDGCATDQPVLEKAIEEMQVCEQEREIEFVPVTPSAEYGDLLFSIFGKEAIPFDGLDFSDIFHALARSISTYSQSMLRQEPSMRLMLENKMRNKLRNIIR